MGENGRKNTKRLPFLPFLLFITPRLPLTDSSLSYFVLHQGNDSSHHIILRRLLSESSVTVRNKLWLWRHDAEPTRDHGSRQTLLDNYTWRRWDERREEKKTLPYYTALQKSSGARRMFLSYFFVLRTLSFIFSLDLLRFSFLVLPGATMHRDWMRQISPTVLRVFAPSNVDSKHRAWHCSVARRMDLPKGGQVRDSSCLCSDPC